MGHNGGGRKIELRTMLTSSPLNVSLGGGGGGATGEGRGC